MPNSGGRKNLSSKKLNRLIELIEKNPVLYDSSHPFNEDTSHMNSLWESIAEELNSQANVLKKHWKKLSSDYFTKSRESGTEYDKALSFLSKHTKEARVSSFVENKENEDSIDRELFEKDGKGSESYFAPGPTPRNTPSDLTNVRVLRPRRSEPARFLNSKKSSSGRKRTKENSANYTFGNSANDEANFAFFQSMALTVSLFPQHLQASIKMRICNLVNETEAQLASQKSN